MYEKVRFVAEIGCNHKGDLDIAKELILLAKKAGADYAKFQKRDNKLLLSEEMYYGPHPNPSMSYGRTYGEHREFLEFTPQEHMELKQFCDDHKIGYSTSVWDIHSAREIIQLNPDFIKVPSAINTNYAVLEILTQEYQGDIHLSLGMTYHHEMTQIFQFLKEKKAFHRVVLYHCTSGYPVSFKDSTLLEILKIKDLVHSYSQIGFSGHHLGTSLDIAAYVLGASWIERHFTKDRSWKGTDHQASLEYQDLKNCIDDLTDVYEALRYKDKELLDVEIPQRKKLKSSSND